MTILEIMDDQRKPYKLSELKRCVADNNEGLKKWIKKKIKFSVTQTLYV